jgi:hypothetical protein
LQEVLAQIRDLPGMSDFGTGASMTEIAAALEVGWPLVYVDPTPVETLLLIAEPRSEGGVSLDVRFLEVSGEQIYMRLVVGGAADVSDPGPDSSIASYLLGIGAAGDAEVPPALNDLLPWLGGSS